jgi:hypothetical protein
MVETVTLRTTKIEKELMIAERLLDGMKTHFDLKRVPPCPLKGTDFDRLVHAACAAVRSARDILRNDMGHKQPTMRLCTVEHGSRIYTELCNDTNMP